MSRKELRSLPSLELFQEDESKSNSDQGTFPFPVEPLTNFCIPIYEKSTNGGELTLISAGRRDGNEFTHYAERVQSFDWQDFYINWEGEQFFNWFRQEAERLADVVLIDSRTGITEMGGICTHHVADVVVMFVGANQQNLDGTLKIAKSLSNLKLIQEGRKGRELSLIPVPSRVENFEAESLDEFAKQFKQTLGQFVDTRLKFEGNLFSDLKIPYTPYYAYQERVAVRELDRETATDLVRAFKRLMLVIAQLAPGSSRLHKVILDTSILNNVPRSGITKFIGRELELERLHTQLRRGDPVSISAVAGMAGAGKTELVIQYSRKYAATYEGGIAWLFVRESNMGTQVIGFAQSQLNLEISEGLELSDQVAFCWHNWREGEVLLILDDVVNYSRDVEPYLPPPAFDRFKVVMTTRRAFGPPIQSLFLDVLSPEQSLELLTVLIGEERVQQELEIANALCQWLGHLALGVELVGHYLLKRTDLLLATLLFRLQEKAKKRQAIKHNALQRDEATGTSTARHGADVAFELSWQELDEPSQHLGKLLSLFAQAPIPWYLVESVEQKYCDNSNPIKEFDLEELESARERLLFSNLLVKVNQETYRLHPLVREFFRSKLEGEETMQLV